MEKLTIDEIEALPKDHLSAEEVSAAMGISRRTFYRHVNELPFASYKVGRKYFIPKHPFLEYLRSGGMNKS